MHSVIPMTDWRTTLYRELDQWHERGDQATLWWRDDDAQSLSAELRQLLNLAQQSHAPLALAVIPHGVQVALASQLRPRTAVTILQHGFAHTNHAPPDEKKAELGNHRRPAAMHAELAAGLAALRKHFAAQFMAVLVPPWNRMAPPLLAGLAQTGFMGLSTFGARPAREPTAGIRALNTHVDIINWKQRRFIGAPLAVAALVAHLKGRRHGKLDRAEATGILTHHHVHDAECWQFLTELFAALNQHPAAQWQAIADAIRA